MANNRQLAPASLQDLTYATLRNHLLGHIKNYGTTASKQTEASNILQTALCEILPDATASKQTEASIILQDVLLDIFLHAVVDDDRQTVQAILDVDPEFLLDNPPANLVIESKHTWRKSYAECALKMAAKLKQINMIELMLPYYVKLPQTDDVIKAKREALSAWKAYEIEKDMYDDVKIIIPKQYADDAQSFINIFKDETFPNGVPGENGVPINVILSKKTESALSEFLNKLVPESAVTLDEQIDVELLLLAIFRAPNVTFGRDGMPTFGYNRMTLIQQKILVIRLLGLVESALIPEYGEIFCKGLGLYLERLGCRAACEDRAYRDWQVEAIDAFGGKNTVGFRQAECGAFAENTGTHKLKGGEDFYRKSRDDRRGNGFEFVCGCFGTQETTVFSREDMNTFSSYLDYLYQANQTKFRKIYDAAIAATARPSQEPPVSTGTG